ncbi:hypothetical protein OL548_03505 [Lysinibacillus sp. MHQ-1]|nr:hypothetical protein OL548_03505 [Lysinibacillus sp. MHQ-1]
MDASKVREALSGATLTIVLDTMMVIVGAVILYTQSAFFIWNNIGYGPCLHIDCMAIQKKPMKILIVEKWKKTPN